MNAFYVYETINFFYSADNTRLDMVGKVYFHFLFEDSPRLKHTVKRQLAIMNNTLSINFDALQIETIRSYVLRSWGITYMIVGTIGTALNLVVFARQAHWSASPCTSYLFASSLATVPLLHITILSRVGIGFQITPFYYIPILCKSQVYVANVSVSLFIWFTIGSFWDRYLSSSRDPLMRNMSSVRNARRTIWMITLCISVAYAQIFYCFEQSIAVGTAPCSARNTQCSIVDTTLIFVVQFIPSPLLIFFFGRSIYSNIQRIPTQAQTSDVSSSRGIQPRTKRNSKAERMIVRLVLVQGFLLLICSSPTCIFRVYTTITLTTSRSAVRRAVENLIFNVNLMVYYVDKVCSFYIHLFTNRHFRSVLRQSLSTIRSRPTVAPQHYPC
jgi:hypothetical protein